MTAPLTTLTPKPLPALGVAPLLARAPCSRQAA